MRRITFLDPDFPEALLALADGPPVLYLAGEPIPAPTSLVSIVGTRRPSAFGISVAKEAAKFFAEAGLGIVSGLARGIDALAHGEAVSAHSYTMAILGNGLERTYPREHATLASSILRRGGTLLTQFPPGAVPHPSHFPRRNQLIAALSAGTLVIEGSPASGALITGKAALEFARTTVVFTQDFRADFGKGALELLLLGAYPATGYQDALRAISQTWGGWLQPLKTPKAPTKPSGKMLRDFSFFDFQNARGISVREAIIEIEKLRAEGKIRNGTEGRYLWVG